MLYTVLHKLHFATLSKFKPILKAALHQHRHCPDGKEVQVTPFGSWKRISSAILLNTEVLKASLQSCLSGTCHKGSIIFCLLVWGWSTLEVLNLKLSLDTEMQLITEFSHNDRVSYKCSLDFCWCAGICLCSPHLQEHVKVEGKVNNHHSSQ